jgi:hypothetical protein
MTDWCRKSLFRKKICPNTYPKESWSCQAIREKNNFESKVMRSLKAQTRQKTLTSRYLHTQEKKSIDLDKTTLTNFIFKLINKVDYLVI